MSIFKENILNSSESWNMKHYILFIPTPHCTSQDLYNEFLCIFPEFIYAWTSMCVCVCIILIHFQTDTGPKNLHA